jgi:hypothetical protein
MVSYVGAVGMLLHINGKFIIDKLKSSLLSRPSCICGVLYYKSSVIDAINIVIKLGID